MMGACFNVLFCLPQAPTHEAHIYTDMHSHTFLKKISKHEYSTVVAIPTPKKRKQGLPEFESSLLYPVNPRSARKTGKPFHQNSAKKKNTKDVM